MRTVRMIVALLILSLSSVAIARVTVEAPGACQQCSMDRTTFAHSRMLVVYADKTVVGVCSLHCAAVELSRNVKKRVSSLMVADYATKELHEAKTATWVIGGKQRGVMTAQAKWAFATAKGAESFVKVNGGTVSSFDQAMKNATAEVKEQAAEEKAVKSEMHHEKHR